MKNEIVFEVGGEGGRICIFRQQTDNGVEFLYDHKEFDPTYEGLDVNKVIQFNNFEEPFHLLNNKYNWHLLYIVQIHADYKAFVSSKLIDKLNMKGITPIRLEYKRGQIENVLQIKLDFNADNIWTFKSVLHLD